MEIKSIGMLLFEDVELLDFAGPLEVFGAANYVNEKPMYSIETVAPTNQVQISKSLLNVNVDQILDGQSYDLFLIPGGFGTREIIKDDTLLSLIKRTIDKSKIIASICTGSLILAKLGLLANKEVCSHHLAYDVLEKLDPTVSINKEARYMDHGNIVTAAGVSAGIDMSFHLLKRFYGEEFASTVRMYIEYYPEKV